MALTSDKVYEMAAKMAEDKNVETEESNAAVTAEETKVETAEPKTVEDPKTEENNNTDAEKPKEEVKEQTNPDNSDEKVVENNEDEETKKPEKKHYSKQEQIDFSFKRLKSKIRKLEERNRQLEEENKKRFDKNLSLEDFQNNYDAYTNYLVDKKILGKEQDRIRDEYEEARREEFSLINEQREKNCFPDENAISQYHKIREQYGPAFVKELDEEDKEQVVLGYLDDCDVAPLMMQILLTNENYKNAVLSKRSPYGKMRALEDLENRIKYAQAEMAKKRGIPEKNEDTKLPLSTKKPLPVIGSVTKSEQSNGPVIKDYNSILHDLNAKRYGH